MQKIKLLAMAFLMTAALCAGAQEAPKNTDAQTVAVSAKPPAPLSKKPLSVSFPQSFSAERMMRAETIESSKNPVERVILIIMNYVVYFSQVLATFVITIGMIKALWTFIRDALIGHESLKAIRESRIELGHSFSLGLGFLIGASILKTTAAPNWDDIGKLSVIIAIRTILNYFMTKEISKYGGNGVEDNSGNGAEDNGSKDVPSPRNASGECPIANIFDKAESQASVGKK